MNADGENLIEEQKPGEERNKKRKSRKEHTSSLRLSKIGTWFQTLCFMNIPVFGFFYMLIKLFQRKLSEEERAFAAAYVIYRLLVLLLAGTILFVLYQIGLDFIDNILKYAERIR